MVRACCTCSKWGEGGVGGILQYSVSIIIWFFSDSKTETDAEVAAINQIHETDTTQTDDLTDPSQIKDEPMDIPPVSLLYSLLPPFRWFKKSSCQFLAKECAQYWLTA